MLPVALLTAAIVFVVMICTLLRALDYIRHHPEVMTNATPLSYHQCQMTLRRIIRRYHEIMEKTNRERALFAWKSLSGHVYTVSEQSIERHHASLTGSATDVLRWEDIGGVGIRMQPDFAFADHNRDGAPESQLTTGYTFSLLIVPFSGSTMNIHIPIDNYDDAIDFVAHTLALAERMQKRINVFGFYKPPAPRRQRVSRI